MTRVLNCGPLWPVDGPPPTPPGYGLLKAAEVPGAGVRIVDDPADPDGRWMNGVEVYPYPTTLGFAVAPYFTGADQATKGFGDEGTALVNPQFGPITVGAAATCRRSHLGWGANPEDAWASRARSVLAAVESYQVARELLTGAQEPLNPFLADSTCALPNGSTTVPVALGLALLEEEIAKSGRLGIIHVPPLVVTFARERFTVDNSTGVIRTILGNVVIADSGYQGAPAFPAAGAPATGTQRWIYATSPIDIRRSEMFTMPDTQAQALDRSLGATNQRSNTVTYRAERYYVTAWDTSVHSAVRVDPCMLECGN